MTIRAVVFDIGGVLEIWQRDDDERYQSRSRS